MSAHPYVVIGRVEWSALRESTPLPLTDDDLARLRGLGEPIDLAEVEEVYLPLSRLLNLQVRARGARTIVIAEDGDTAVEPYADLVIRIPEAPTLLQPLLSTVPLQVFACEMATARGHDVDQPRNLAKSVTVE